MERECLDGGLLSQDRAIVVLLRRGWTWRVVSGKSSGEPRTGEPRISVAAPLLHLT
jgi:hypothetical protein